MLKKITSLFLFISIFSLQAIGRPELPKISDFNNLVQESYDRWITHPCAKEILPKKPIIDELTQGYFIYLFKEIFRRSIWSDITALAFYSNIQQIELLKKYVNNSKHSYLIAADIHKTKQEIKDIFNITTEPTVIYYHNFKEIARNNNFDSNDMLQHIKNNAHNHFGTPKLRFFELKNLIQESYNESIIIPFGAGVYENKIVLEKPIRNELAQLRFLAFLETLQEHTMFKTNAITAVVFYDNANQIEPLKNLFKKHKSAYLIAADINKTEQEIKNAFNITKPTIIYYQIVQEITRSINFTIENVLHCINNHLNNDNLINISFKQ